MKGKTAAKILATISMAVLIAILSLAIASIAWQETEKISTEKAEMLKTNYENCNVEKPGQGTIILRLDDVGANRLELAKAVTNAVLEQNYAVTLGIIPTRLDSKTDSWLKTLKNDNRIEFALHGYEHTDYEFSQLSKEEIKNKLELGRKLIYDKLGEVPLTFIPPNNKYNENLLLALKEEGFKIISAKENELGFGTGFASIGYTTYTKMLNGELQINDIIERCGKKLDETGICVIMIHPQDFRMEGTGEIDEARLDSFGILLESLKKLNAEPKTFKSLVKCENSGGHELRRP